VTEEAVVRGMRLGEEVMENGPYQGQMVGEEVTELLETMCRSEERVSSDLVGRRRGDEKVFDMDKKEGSVDVWG
jgi:hypothetical protein